MIFNEGMNRLPTIFSLVLCVLLLVACNPKPEQIEEVTQDVPDYLIDNPDKLLGASPSFDEADLIMQGLERMSHYFDVPWSSGEQEKIFVNTETNYHSYIDYLEIILSKEHPILPKYGDSQEIKEQIDRGNPVLAVFPLSGGMDTEVLFYGYNDQSFFYYQLSSLNERKVPIERMDSYEEKELKLFIYDNGLTELDSEYYFLLLTRDIYQKDDVELYKKAIARIESEDWLDKDEAYKRFYVLYYTFYDPKPDLVEPYLEELSYNPILNAEISFMLPVLRGDTEKALEAMSQMNLSAGQLPIYRDETIYQVGLLALENDRLELARTTLQFLNSRNPDYPGLSEALDQLAD